MLYHITKKMLVDIIRNRQLPYLNEYFSDIKEKERDKEKNKSLEESYKNGKRIFLLR